MANIAYFAEENGQPVRLTSIWHDGGVSTRALNFSGLTPSGVRITAQRMIELKSNPSRHVCDARCVHATGKVMKCECSCGGKNHGRGA